MRIVSPNAVFFIVFSPSTEPVTIPQRLGFKQEGRLHQTEWLYNKFVDHFVFGLLKEDWEQQ